jgi:molybdate transport system substrate-binding protein
MASPLRSSALVAIALSLAPQARADQVTLIAPRGIRAALEQLIPLFECKTGHTVKATSGSGGGTKQQVIRGDPFDVPIVQPPLGPVIASGHVVAASETPLATVAVAVAVKKAAPKPDISTPAAVRRMLLAALGIDEMKPKVVRAQGGAGGKALVAFLSSLGAVAVYRANGMEPARPGR